MRAAKLAEALRLISRTSLDFGAKELARAALASYEAEPAVQVVVERERVWVKRGVQSFALAYEADTDAEREWYAKQLRTALAAPAAPAPLTDEQIEAITSCLGFGQLSPITVARAIEQAHGIGIAASKETK
jgi:hypothetical protein